MLTNVMKRYIKVSLIVLLVVQAMQVQCQDIQFSQFYTAALYQNPAFAGSAHFDRAMFHQRLQWPKLDGKYTTSMFSYDKFFRRYSSGFGLMVLQDFQGASNISSTEVHFQYAYEVFLNSKFTFRPGIQLGVGQRYLNYNDFVFPRNLDDNGFIPGSSKPESNNRIIYPDVSSGALVYSDNLWIGYSAHHINRPNQSFLGDIIKYPIKHAFTGGYKILMHKHLNLNYQGEDPINFTITPTFHYKFQGKSDQLDLGIYAMYDWLVLGFWYRGIPFKTYEKLSYLNNESYVALGGVRFGKFTVNYSYDFSVSKIGWIGQTGGAHEINLTFINQNKQKKKKKTMKRLPCPDFYQEIIKEDLSH